jgi:uncharacterized protein (UPF0335 family)
LLALDAQRAAAITARDQAPKRDDQPSIAKAEAGNQNTGEGEMSGTPQAGSNSNEQLKSIVERIERLEEEKAERASDIKDVYAESKSNGYDVKALRTIIRLRKQDPDDRQEAENILETYMHALGMV